MEHWSRALAAAPSAPHWRPQVPKSPPLPRQPSQQVQLALPAQVVICAQQLTLLHWTQAVSPGAA